MLKGHNNVGSKDFNLTFAKIQCNFTDHQCLNVINKEVADSKPYVIKVALDHFILLTGIFGSYKNKKFLTFY